MAHSVEGLASSRVFGVFFQGLRVVACSVCFAQVRGSCSWGSAALKIRRRNPAVIPRFITLNLKTLQP